MEIINLQLVKVNLALIDVFKYRYSVETLPKTLISVINKNTDTETSFDDLADKIEWNYNLFVISTIEELELDFKL